MKKIVFLFLAVMMLFTGCAAPDQAPVKDPVNTPASPTDIMPTGTPETKPILTGWVEQAGKYYYFLEDGTLATGKHVIDGKECCFGTDGAQIILVNPWNYKPEGYDPPLVSIGGGKYVHEMCYDDLMDMLDACLEAGHTYNIDYAYRSFQLQTRLYLGAVDSYLKAGFSRKMAGKQAGKATAVPGTSEHELGLALDIVDKDRPGRNSAQANTDTQKWLMANSWKYGFILRYPNGKTDITGIIYEPWHYRYVGKEIAAEIYESGMCLEEYLAAMQ